jgi:DNA modification methylase
VGRLNTLYYGDNLEVLREHIPTESIDLVYLDPPFNSNRNYNVLFARHDVAGTDQAQIQAFGDTWRWTATTEEQFDELVTGGLPLRVADTLAAFRMMLGENDTMAYLVNITPRLVEIKRVLKPTFTVTRPRVTT